MKKMACGSGYSGFSDMVCSYHDAASYSPCAGGGNHRLCRGAAAQRAIARIIVPGVLFTAMLSAPALAAINHATSHTSHRSSEGSSNLRMSAAAIDVQCSTLQQQFDEVVMARQTVGQSSEVRAWATTRNVCVNGDPAEGVVKLRQALTNLGVKPKA